MRDTGIINNSKLSGAICDKVVDLILVKGGVLVFYIPI